TVTDSDLSDATISMASNMRGATLQNVKFGGNLSNVDMRGATLRKVEFSQVNASELDLRGARLQDVTIDGQPVTSSRQLEVLGIKTDATTQIHASQQHRIEQQLKGITEGMGWLRDMPQPQAPPEMAAQSPIRHSPQPQPA